MIATMEQFLTVEEVASRLKVSLPTVRRWIKRGSIQAVKPGGDKTGYRVSEEALEDFIRRHTTAFGTDGHISPRPLPESFDH